jgi:hypothetical protein
MEFSDRVWTRFLLVLLIRIKAPGTGLWRNGLQSAIVLIGPTFWASAPTRHARPAKLRSAPRPLLHPLL